MEMALNTSTKPAGARTRVSWTVEMLKDLEECRDKAKNLHRSDNAPRKPNGRKVGYMDLMLKFWNEKGYSELNLTKQNLRDRLSHAEKSTVLQKQVRETVIEEVEQQRNNETELSEDSHHNNTDNNTTETVNKDPDNNDLIIPNKELYGSIQQSFEKYAVRKAKCLKECIQLKQRNYPHR